MDNKKTDRVVARPVLACTRSWGVRPDIVPEG